MARHNFLIQRHVQGPDGSNANVSGKGAEWRDLGTGYTRSAPDAFGNTGYSNREQALEALADCRRNYPKEAYRVIQIIS
jgi:ribulose bisphosphate carboxylase small subunit